MSDPTTSSDFLTLLSVLSLTGNVALIASAVKIIRNLARMELKVDTMWAVFVRRFGTRGTDHSEADDDGKE